MSNEFMLVASFVFVVESFQNMLRYQLEYFYEFPRYFSYFLELNLIFVSFCRYFQEL
jgi:hypothetical protein